ncbi:Tfp pilus assembly protein FimT/FimU [Psychrobacter urativorans]|uniref:pilus assembly FimT family protein n=1 Tax=Psychrobacter urativorans TaxID=45610 RepID=UPI001D1013B9|nr:prepilin-type N-terminal cleavage/methylation domain-containing protein [Psychrobacter urativorans]
MNASINSSSYPQLASSSGFTLIELMVTIAVLAIIVSIAAPNISTQLANQRVKSTTATLNNALKEAKVESVIRRQVMSLTYKNSSMTPGTISITDPESSVVATYQYDTKSIISAANSKIDFKPNKTADEKIYTICDSNSVASPRQIMVSAVANITSQLGGKC